MLLPVPFGELFLAYGAFGFSVLLLLSFYVFESCSVVFQVFAKNDFAADFALGFIILGFVILGFVILGFIILGFVLLW